MVFGPSNSDSDAVGYYIISIILIPVILLCIVVVVLLSVNIKMAHDMTRAGGQPAQQVVYVTAQDGTHQAMVVQGMNREGSGQPAQQVLYVTAQDGTQQAMVVQQIN